MKLTLKQKRFADEYIISGNATEAAIKAGYSKKTAGVVGAENLKKPYIKAYVDEQLAKLASQKIAQQEEILQYLTSVLRGESSAEIVVIEGEGDGVSSARRIDKAPDEKERLKAAELLGKRYGMWTEKIGLEEKTLETVKESLSLSEKMRVIQQAVKSVKDE
nr:MAG TPA: Terminase small subunit [Caudoviricetes sp.]